MHFISSKTCDVFNLLKVFYEIYHIIDERMHWLFPISLSLKQNIHTVFENYDNVMVDC